MGYILSWDIYGIEGGTKGYRTQTVYETSMFRAIEWGLYLLYGYESF